MPLNSTDIPGLYCVGDSTFPGQGVNAVVFSGFGCAHRALCDLGIEPSWPSVVDNGFRSMLRLARESASRMGELPEATFEPSGVFPHSNAAAEEDETIPRLSLEARTLISNIVPLGDAMAKRAKEALSGAIKLQK